MTTSIGTGGPRGLRLVRLLLGASAPLAAVSSVASVSLMALGGCSCPEQTTTFLIDRDTTNALATKYGYESSLPISECNKLCVSPRLNDGQFGSVTASSGAGGSSAGGSSAGGSSAGGSSAGGSSAGGSSAGGSSAGGSAGGGSAGGGDVGGQGGEAAPDEFVSEFVSISNCHLSTVDWIQDAVTCVGQANCSGGAGRRPPGFVSHAQVRAAGRSEVARYLAKVAELEQASVFAFRRLAEELTLHRAPLSLIDAAQAAAVEEQHHAQLVGALAQRCGYEPDVVDVRPMPLRGLLELALDNAREGCVGETYAAREASFAAASATDPVVAAVWQRIAVDEAAHAALSFAIDDWARGQLGARAGARLERARMQAAERLQREMPVHSVVLQQRLGLPSAASRATLLEQLQQQLWRAAA